MISVVLGPEGDRGLIDRLFAEVRLLGGTIAEKDWCLGGSEEFIAFEITLGDCTLEAICETYVGLSLRGRESDVMALAHRILPDRPLHATAYDGA